ncbi:hypothetical protein EV44_g0378 [Erysiphe necator]|uniref:Uncharacterized protein n=1 Tax=Uncinula necator TaxID=52586 RepID=A0A0B1P4M0_UNCNE|nr:hypothetical protein EV44_g0378 [Erysiphe necator]
MPSKSIVWICSVGLIWQLVMPQSFAVPLPLNAKQNHIASLDVRSTVAEKIHPRFAGAILGGLATTVVGNALGGAISPVFQKIGEKMGGSNNEPEPVIEEEQTEEEEPVAKTKISKAQKVEETETSTKLGNTSKSEKLEISEAGEKSTKSQKSKELEDLEEFENPELSEG